MIHKRRYNAAMLKDGKINHRDYEEERLSIMEEYNQNMTMKFMEYVAHDFDHIIQSIDACIEKLKLITKIIEQLDL